MRIVFGDGRANILDASTIDALRDALPEEGRAPALRLVVLEGDGRDFSFGASVAEHLPDAVEAMLPAFHALISDLVHLDVPTAALVRGRCLGGGLELAAACDVIFAESTSRFGQPEVHLGVFAPAGSVLLPARIGHARAADLLLTGRTIDGSEAHHLGLAAVLAEPGELAAAFARWVGKYIEPRSAVALSAAARAARRPVRDAVDRHLATVETLYLDEVARSADGEEGIRSFLEKRSPRWTHR